MEHRSSRFVRPLEAPRFLELIEESYQRTLEGVFRFNLLTYHLRPSYFFERIKRDVRFISNRCMPRQRVQSIFAKQESTIDRADRKAA